MAKFKLEDGTEVEAFTKDELDAEVAGLKNKLTELLGESKTAKQKAAELEAEKAAAEQERLREKGEFEALYKQEQLSKQQLQEQFEAHKKQIEAQTKAIAGAKIAGQLTKDTGRAELLAEKAEALSKIVDGATVYEIGGVVVDEAKVLEHLKSRYPFLVDGSGASGGGATGGAQGAARKALKDMSEAERLQFKTQDPAGFAAALRGK